MSYVFAAYLVVLGGIGFYAWSLAYRFAQARKEIPLGEESSADLSRN